MSSYRVLVVDDSLITIKRLSAMIEDVGHQVVGSAGSGEQAVHAYRACNPDLVTMDITMADMDGIEATRRILSEFPDAVIIVVTSHGQERMVIESITAGAKGYVLKPVRADNLKAMIERAMARAPAAPAPAPEAPLFG